MSKEKETRETKAANKKQAFKEGAMDNTGKINQSNQQHGVDKKIEGKGQKQKDEPFRG